MERSGTLQAELTEDGHRLERDSQTVLEAALENHQRILQLKRHATRSFILLGKEFRENKDQRYFELLGFPTFEAYIESPEVCFQRRSVYSLIAIYEKFVEELSYSPEELAAVDYSKLDRLLPVLNVQPVAHREWFEKAKRLTRRDLEAEIRAFRCNRTAAGISPLPVPPEVPLPAGWVNTVQQGDCLYLLKMLPDDSIDFCMTSPPFWGMRDYGIEGQLGLEPTWQEYVGESVRIYREVTVIRKGDQQENHVILGNATGSQEILPRMKPIRSTYGMCQTIWTHCRGHRYTTTLQLR